MDFVEKMQRCSQYVEALEEEKKKIQVFQRELPLCLELVTQAIEACRRELISGTTAAASECTEQTTSEGRPVLEEFIPLKRSCSSNIEENEEENDGEDDNNTNNDEEEAENKNQKIEWLRSVQLWNNQSSLDPPSREELPRKAKVMEVNRSGGGAFQPFHKEKSVEKSSNNHKSPPPPPKENGKPSSVPPMVVPASSTTAEGDGDSNGGGNSGTNNKNSKKEEKNQRKQRRCWSPELHRRFLQSLQQLGGPHAATPKQIRELMKIDGLTNDEVKSHLQKYRLHTRRPSTSSHNNGNTTQPPQFLVVGGIWVPPHEYAAVASTSAPGEAPTTNGIYTPIATPAHQITALLIQRPETDQQLHSGGCSHAHSNSPATSSSTRTS